MVKSTILGGFADLSAKVRKIIDILGKLRVKYILSVAVVLIFVQFVFGLPAAPAFINARVAAIQQDPLKRDSVRRVREMREMAEEEAKEQAALRAQYLAEFRANMEATLQAVRVEQADGSYKPLEKKKLN